jgi:hypothetical protein
VVGPIQFAVPLITWVEPIVRLSITLIEYANILGPHGLIVRIFELVLLEKFRTDSGVGPAKQSA